ncbi:MAG: hypothetical protein LBH30_06995 [Prevotellaceae bacterium]|jgi:hypothetical protein|nr:hypothetical protein [Prevotellaceae bacterium]
MKKSIILGLIFVSAVCICKAQSYETSVEMSKIGYQNAVAIDLPYKADDVEKTVEKVFAANGLKGKNASKGFTEYKNVKFKKFSNETISIYTKVDKNKQNKNESKVYILVATQDGIFCTSGTCQQTIQNVKEFANQLNPHVELYVTTVLLNKNVEDMKKAEKELRNLQSDSVSLQKDKEKILNKIEENSQNMHNKQQEIEMKRQIVNETQVHKAQQESDLPK